MVAAVGAVTIALKSVGPVLLGGRGLPERATGVLELLAPSLLAALIATQTLGGDRELVLDERAVGVAAAALGLVARLPILAVVVLAAGATALARSLG